MAEKGCGATTVARRVSFRKTVRENQSILPDQYLEALEQKRRQLDESIHKYVAAKEREYKVYEKDVRQQAKSADASPTPSAQQDEGFDSNASRGLTGRRISSEGTPDEVSAASRPGDVESRATNGVAASGVHSESGSQVLDDDGEKQSVANADVTSKTREKEFIGVFTPQYLPAIDNGELPKLVRADSAPEPGTRDDGQMNKEGSYKADSDSGLKAKAKRPAHLQAVRRTSSSGSSADGKLTSAMKSPAHYANPSKKRVSLAVGDSIVAPSDSVPLALDHHSTPSHSRTRIPVAEREQPSADGNTVAIMDFAAPPALSSMERVEHIMSGATAPQKSQDKEPATSGRAPPLPGTTSTIAPAPRLQSNIDPDGDLFDLEDDSGIPHTQAEQDEFDSAFDAEDNDESGILGRVDPDISTIEPTSPSMAPLSGVESLHANDEADMTAEPTALPSSNTLKDDEHAVHLEFGPGFATSSQQPTQPGFRRPSVNVDPVFRGADYQAVEAQAVEDEIYGSSYTRPTSKGSFTGGSLGGSYMAKHAEGMMKLRIAQRQTG